MTPPSAEPAVASNGDSVAELRPRPALAIAPTDGERLMQFTRRRDEAAFRELVEAHAPLVWGVCWQVLRHAEDAEDAFQATFLILARRAPSIRVADSVAGWLYRVAFRTALMARSRRARRAEVALIDEPQSADDQLAAVHRREQCLLLLEELHALPDRYRAPLALCYLEGRSRREAADELGITATSVKGLLARGIQLLRSRLVRRGVALSGAMAVATAHAATAQAAMSPALVGQTAALVLGFALKASGVAVGGSLASGAAHTLAEKGLRAMTMATLAKPAAGVMALCVASVMAAATVSGPGSANNSGGAPALSLTVAEAQVVDDAEFAVEPAAPLAAEPAIVATIADAPASVTAITAETPIGAIIAAEPAFGAVAQAAAPAAGTPTAPITAIAPTATITTALAPLTTSNALSAPTAWVDTADRASEASIKLEIDYWALKARGLTKQAEALRQKASAYANGQGSALQVLEAEAEADLSLAEVKLCEANAQRLKDILAAPQSQPTTTGAPPGQSQLTPPMLYPVAPMNPPTERRVDTFSESAPTGSGTSGPYGYAPAATYDPAPQTAPAGTTSGVDELKKLLYRLNADNDKLRKRIEQLESAEHANSNRYGPPQAGAAPALQSR